MSLSRLTAFPLVVVTLALTQCANDSKEPPKAVEPVAEEPMMVPASRVVEPSESSTLAPDPTKASALTDAQIFAACDVGHSAVIDQARIAQATAKDPRVRQFAQMMLADHGQARQVETGLAVELGMSPAESQIGIDMGVASGKTLYAMREADVVDEVYVDGQIAAHEKFLADLGQWMIPNARTSQLRGALEASRTRCTAHLEKARELKAALAERSEVPIPGDPTRNK